MPKIKGSAKLKMFFLRLPKFLAQRAFLTFLLLFLISLMLGSLVFYRYSLAKKEMPQTQALPLQFKEKTYENLLTIWRERGERFEESKTKTYPNLFQPLTK